MTKKEENQRPSSIAKARWKHKKKPEVKTKKVTFRCTVKEYDTILRSSKIVNNSLAKFCRLSALNHRIRDMTEETRHFRLVITQGCNNLNQIAKHLNKEGINSKLIEQVKQQILFLQKLRDKIN